MAIRLQQAGVGTARFWLASQANHDLAQALPRAQPPVKALRAA